MKKTSILSGILLLSALVSAGYCAKPPGPGAQKGVSIINKNSHYEVVIDFQKQPSHRKIGAEMGAQIKRMVPNYEFLMDSYLNELATAFPECFQSEEMLKRIGDIKPQLKPEYREEIEGMASRISSTNQTVIGDNKLSVDELYMINLILDVFRPNECSALGVYGKRSATGKTIAARLVDWHGGSQNQMAQIQAVTTFKNGPNSLCSVGWLGYFGVSTGLNNNNVFAGSLGSDAGESYSSQGKSSIVFDIRYALEHSNNLDQVANYMKSPVRTYTSSHLIFLGDTNTCKVLENNSSTRDTALRAVRTENSALNEGVEWGIDNSIGCVNSFVLKGNPDNHTPYLSNTARWDSLKRELAAKGSTVNLEQVKAVATYHPGSLPGEEEEGGVYHEATLQIILWEASKPVLHVFFQPKSGILPGTPTFEQIPVSF